jgi:16S rRNA (guanine966-N2)-methyltransferase
MRVVSGDFRGLKLSAVPGMSTRPTTDKVKEALFNMIGPYFESGSCLDLYGGSGGLAIESISRGMDHAVVVDRAYPAIKTIRQNISKTHHEDSFTVIKADVRRAMKIMQSHQDRFDLVFLDPPYAKQQIQADMNQLQKLGLLNPGATIVAETNQEAQLPAEWASFKLQRRQDYGITVIRIYRYDGGNES